MYRCLVVVFLFINILYSKDLNSLLEEYNTKTENSLSTVDEKFGHVIIYSQKELRLMQYNSIKDVLKELPLNNLSKNKFGVSTLSLPGSKTDVSGFFRFFINDHEVSSIYSQSPSMSWIDMPLDFVDYIEVYRGNSSFSLGNETGVFFIRIYTKSAIKENGSQLKTNIATHGSNNKSIMHSEVFENGWSFLSYFNHSDIKDYTYYKNNRINNNSIRRYGYLDITNENTKINFGYTDVKKDNYLGLSLDGDSDNGEIESTDYFVDMTKYFLYDKSIKFNFSLDVNNMKYMEENSSGLSLIPVVDLNNMGGTIPKKYNQNIQLTKINSYLSKNIESKDNNILIALNLQHKKYDTKENKTVNFANVQNDVGAFNSFNEEKVYSLMIQDDYSVNDEIFLIANGKINQYYRSGYLDNFTTEEFRIGSILTPHKNIGFKSFYTKTYLPPSFYNIDYADSNSKNMKTQVYKYYTLEGVYAKDKSKFSLIYNNVMIDNFIYYTPVGFTNIENTIKTEGLIFDYSYNLSKLNRIEFNYYMTWLSEVQNNSSRGGYFKFMGEHNHFEYFTSLIYRNDYTFKDVDVSSSFDFSIGSTYNISKNLSLSLKAENLFDKATESIHKEGFNGADFSLENNQRIVSFSIKWVF